jgi:hypothetical protein
MTRSNSVRLAGSVAGLLLACIAAVAWTTSHRHRAAPVTRPVAGAVEVLSLPASASAAMGQQALVKALADGPYLERDLAFLYVSAWQMRCDAPRGHALVRLAMAAGLPTLRATGKLIDARPALGPVLYELIRDWARRTPCATPSVELRLLGYRLRISPTAYTRAFPESYVDPGNAAMAAAYPDMPDVADSPCLRLAYRLLPLAEDVAWQCATARRDLRRQIVQTLCPTDIALPAGQARLAAQVHERESRLPTLCR